MSTIALPAGEAPPVDLFLDANEGPPIPAATAAAWAGAIADPELWRRYPDQRPLQRLLARRFAVADDAVALGAGADELLDRICRAWLAPGRTLVAPVPCFVMLRQYVTQSGARLLPVPWTFGALPVAALRDACRTSGASVLAITSPNNPTGLVADVGELLELAQQLPGTLLLADLAYVEFADHDPTAALLGQPNVVVVRTCSKGLGLAGLRVGYALGAPAAIAPITAKGSPFPCSGIALALAERALQTAAGTVVRSSDGDDWRTAGIAAVRAEREPLCTALRALGFEPLPSQANFVFARGRDREAAVALATALRQRGIAIRTFAATDPLLAAAVRITCPGDAVAFARLLTALSPAGARR